MMNTKTKIQLSVMMFLEFFVWGAWFVTMWRYLNRLNFDGTQIGAAYSTTGWAAIISPFFVGMIADRFFSAQKVMAVLHLLGALLMSWTATITEPILFFWVLLAYTVCYMPTLALSNSISFAQMTNPETEFPPIRVLGTIGWITAGLLVGFMPKGIFGLDTIEDTNIPMWIAAGASLLLAVYSLFLPNTPPKTTGQQIRVSDILGLKSLGLLKDRSFAVFILCSLLICIPLSFYYQSANGFLGEIGLKNPAAKMTLGQVSEFFFMLMMPFLIARLGIKKMMLLAMGAWVLRYVFFAFGNTQSMLTTSYLYLGILLHGICYDFFFVSGQIYVDKKAPSDIRAGAQGFIAFVTLGLGMIIGNLINGFITRRYSTSTHIDNLNAITHNWQTIWLFPAAMAIAVFILFALSFSDKISAKNPTDGR
ncbi:MAG TPA: nucleoside permease [Anaerohalosphaeraceae bacterium]|nr:nucleoside permease [Anaerohalosphaeraceae bacterium]